MFEEPSRVILNKFIKEVEKEDHEFLKSKKYEVSCSQCLSFVYFEEILEHFKEHHEG